MIIETTKLYILRSVCIYTITLTVIQGHSCMRTTKLVSIFLEISQWIWLKFSMLPQPVGMLNSMCLFVCLFSGSCISFFLLYILCKYDMGLWNQLCLFHLQNGQPAVLCGKNCNIGHHMKTFQPNLFIPAICKDTDLYHFQWPYPWLGITRSAQSWLHFLTHFSIDQDESWHTVEAI